ncbi:hypothetical protein FO519_008372 [Halicephalobus sp. NKZ332]|nr:hypothetical protein FO519_008372 [Halicephalobus sp. NKZ332]
MEVPKTQRALVIHEFAKGQVLETNFPVKEPGIGEVLVNIKFSGVCHSDVELSEGRLPIPVTLPVICGHEATGVVVKVGENVTNFKVGDTVGIMMMFSSCQDCEYCKVANEFHCKDLKLAAIHTHGTFQEYTVVSARHVHKIPDNVDLSKAAPLHCAGVTVYRALKESSVKPGQFVVITGAAGGLGSFGLQFARTMGMRVIAVDLGEEKRQHCLDLGAEHFIDAAKPDFIEQVVTLTNGGPHGAVHVATATKPVEDSFLYLRKRGTVVVVGLPRDPIFKGDIGMFVLKGITVKGSILGNRKDMDEVVEFFARGVINVPVKVMGLSDVPEILKMLHENKITGRIVVDPKK